MSSKAIFRHIENRYYWFLDKQRAIKLSLQGCIDPGKDPDSQSLWLELKRLEGKIQFAEELLALEKNG